MHFYLSFYYPQNTLRICATSNREINRDITFHDGSFHTFLLNNKFEAINKKKFKIVKEI